MSYSLKLQTELFNQSPSTYLLKKNTIERASELYKTLMNHIKIFEEHITKLINKSENKESFDICDKYNKYLYELIHNIKVSLTTKKDLISDELLIKPVNNKIKDYYTQIWYAYNIEQNDIIKIYPSSIICKYDNFSIKKCDDEYEILVGKNNYHFKFIKQQHDISIIEDHLKLSLNDILILHEQCLSNFNMIRNYLKSFTRIYV